MKSYPLKTIELPNGETLGYREGGRTGPVIVLLHGNLTSSKHMEILMERLEDSYKLFALDMRGFGISTYHQRIGSLKDLADDIRLFADELKLKKFSLLGWSTGGAVAMQFAADHPHLVEKLVLIESVGIKGYRFFKNPWLDQPAWAENLAAQLMASNHGAWQQLKSPQGRQFIRHLWDKTIYTRGKPVESIYEEYLDDALTQRNFTDINYALLNYNISSVHNGVQPGSGAIELIQAPTLVIQGEQDLVVPSHIGEEIAAALGNKARLVILPNCGHAPFFDCLPVTVQLIRDFV
jgi:pimeloyl-ACP methyl ester carboxylesterase